MAEEPKEVSKDVSRLGVEIISGERTESIYFSDRVSKVLMVGSRRRARYDFSLTPQQFAEMFEVFEDIHFDMKRRGLL